MTETPKKMAVGSMVVAAVVAVAAICDLVLHIPFSGGEAGAEHVRTMDILFIISAAIVAYLGWDAYRDLR